MNRKKTNPVREIAIDVDVIAVTYCRVECCCCERIKREKDVNPDAFAASLHKRGWRFGVSRSFGVQGAICPVCRKIPDAKRPDECETPADYCDWD